MSPDSLAWEAAGEANGDSRSVAGQLSYDPRTVGVEWLGGRQTETLPKDIPCPNVRALARRSVPPSLALAALAHTATMAALPKQGSPPV